MEQFSILWIFLENLNKLEYKNIFKHFVEGKITVEWNRVKNGTKNFKFYFIPIFLKTYEKIILSVL